MIRFTSLKSAALVAATGAVTTLAIQASGGGAVAQSARDADQIEGVWDVTVARKDCASAAVLGTQKAATLCHRGCTFSNDNSTAPTTHGAMFGTPVPLRFRPSTPPEWSHNKSAPARPRFACPDRRRRLKRDLVNGSAAPPRLSLQGNDMSTSSQTQPALVAVAADRGEGCVLTGIR